MFSYSLPLTDRKQEQLAQSHYNVDLLEQLPKWHSDGLSADAIEKEKAELLARKRWIVDNNYQKILGINQISEMLLQRFDEEFIKPILELDILWVTTEELIALKINMQNTLARSPSQEEVQLLLAPIIGRRQQMENQLAESKQELANAIKLRQAAEQQATEEARLRQAKDQEIATLKQQLAEALLARQTPQSNATQRTNENVTLIFSDNSSHKRDRCLDEKTTAFQNVHALEQEIFYDTILSTEVKKLKTGK